MKRCIHHDRNLVGDPIDVVTGANIDQTRDFVLAGELPVEWWRYYDSRWKDEDRGLGYGHRHPFDHWLVFDLDGITYRHVGGQEIYFPYIDVDGEGASSGGYTLERKDERRYLVHRRGERSLEFHRVRRDEGCARLAAIHGDRSRIVLLYEDDRLVSILAPNDDTLSIEWQGDHIASVVFRDRDGRAETFVRYRYRNDLLVEGIDAYNHSFTFGYDADRRVNRRTDRAGFSFYWEYDAEGRCIHNWGDDGLLDTQLVYYPLEHRTNVIDANGGEWIYEYLPNGIVVSITDPLGGQKYYDVADDGRTLAEYDEKGAKTEYSFDAAGAPIAKRMSGGEKPPHRVPSHPMEWELGDLWEIGHGLPSAEELPADLTQSVRASLITSEDAMRGRVETRTDRQGLRLRQELEDGRRRRFAYSPNGLTRRQRDFDGSESEYHYDSWNHVVAAVDPLGAETRFEYTASEQISSIVDPCGVRSDYAYDALGRLSAVWRAGELRESYRYDPTGRIAEKRDSEDRLLLAFDYDLNGNLVSRRFGSGEEHVFSYDKGSRRKSARAPGLACEFDYDIFGHCLADLRNDLGVRHVYCGDDLVETSVLDRFRTRYEHIRAHKIIVVVDPTGQTHRIRRHGHGIFTRDFASGLSETAQFHPRGWCLTKRLYSRADDASVRARDYAYSGEGDLLEIDDGCAPVRFTYDAAHRLEQVIRESGVEQYRYNRAGALQQSPTLGVASISNENRLRWANGDELEYDNRHHVAFRVGASGSTQYRYDCRDQLIEIERNGWSWRAAYDPLGRRAWKEIERDGAVDRTKYYWDGDRLAAEVFGSGSLRVYVYADAFAMVPMLFVDYASIDAAPESGRVYIVLSDQRGCPEEIRSSSGEIVWRARVDPYGYAHVDIGVDFHQPLRFPGHWYDAESGLHYNRFRYYDPSLGWYLQSDPWGLGGSAPVHSAPANPLTRVDVLGLSCNVRDPQPLHPDDPEQERLAHAGPHDPVDGVMSTRPNVSLSPDFVQAFNPRVHPDGHVIVGNRFVISGDPHFQAGVLRDLDTLHGTPSGNRLLRDLDAGPHSVAIDRSGNDGPRAGARPHDTREHLRTDDYCDRIGDDAVVGVGRGSATNVSYDPDQRDMSGPWQRANPGTPVPPHLRNVDPAAQVGHELGHAQRNSRGIATSARGQEERENIGVRPVELHPDASDEARNAANGLVTENQIRSDLGLGERPQE